MRPVLFLIALCLVAMPASAQTLMPDFARDTLVLITADGAEHRFSVELAQTPEERAFGLMFQESLAPDSGMLFDYGRPRRVTMWMKNTLIPLDMLFIAADGRIRNIRERAVPQSLAPIPSDGRVRGVLELRGGTVDRLGIAAGDLVRHPIFTEN